MEKNERGDYIIVVSDTSPLISLMKIGRLELVEQLFGEVQIPENGNLSEVTENSLKKEENPVFGRLFFFVIPGMQKDDYASS